jgi:DNA-directed RNA polymerase I subunit RPA1
MHCPGHLGHLELCVPVYHPLHFASLFTLLRSKCAVCHKFRMSDVRVRHTLLKLKLLDMDNVKVCISLTHAD